MAQPRTMDTLSNPPEICFFSELLDMKVSGCQFKAKQLEAAILLGYFHLLCFELASKPFYQGEKRRNRENTIDLLNDFIQYVNNTLVNLSH